MKKIKPSFIREDERGLFVEAVNGMRWQNIIYGKMKKGAVMGNHYHKEATVFFFVIKGKAKVNVINIENKQKESTVLKKNEGVILEPLYSHAICFSKKSVFVMGKSHKYDPDNSDTFKYPVPEF